jgi:hypothetical protein
VRIILRAHQNLYGFLLDVPSTAGDLIISLWHLPDEYTKLISTCGRFLNSAGGDVKRLPRTWGARG